jgi:hypothetical protein
MTSKLGARESQQATADVQYALEDFLFLKAKVGEEVAKFLLEQAYKVRVAVKSK